MGPNKRLSSVPKSKPASAHLAERGSNLLPATEDFSVTLTAVFPVLRGIAAEGGV